VPSLRHIPRLTMPLLMAFLLAVAAGAADQELLLYVDSQPSPWNDSQLERKLVQTFARQDKLRLTTVDRAGHSGPAFPENPYDIDSVVNWGAEIGGRYLMIVMVESERLERRKGFHIPLVFHKYQTFGVIEGELRVVDIARGRLLIAEPFSFEQEGPRAFQATMDDDINDPDLHLTAYGKIAFFDELEKSASQGLVDRVGAVIRAR